MSPEKGGISEYENIYQALTKFVSLMLAYRPTQNNADIMFFELGYALEKLDKLMFQYAMQCILIISKYGYNPYQYGFIYNDMSAHSKTDYKPVIKRLLQEKIFESFIEGGISKIRFTQKWLDSINPPNLDKSNLDKN